VASVYEFELKGATFSAIKENGTILVPIAPLCAELKIDPHAQQQRIDRDEILRSGACIIHAPDNRGRPQRMNCLPLRFLAYWLLGVSLKHIEDDKICAQILAFKYEAIDVLFAYFMPDYAAVMGVTLPTFEARLVHQDLFDRAEETSNIIPLRPELARREDAIAAKESSDRAAHHAGQARDASLDGLKKIIEIDNRTRRDPTKEACMCSKHIVFFRYGGLCPCCQKIVIMKNPDRLENDAAHWDHAVHVHKNGPYHGWYVCKKCNNRFEDPEDTYRSDTRPAWDNYLRHVKDYFRIDRSPRLL
jgi:hypothetical protein